VYIYPRCVSTTFPNCGTIKDRKIQIGGFLFGPSNIFFEKFGAKKIVCLLNSNFRGLSKVASKSKPSFLRVLFYVLKLLFWSFTRVLYLPILSSHAGIVCTPFRVAPPSRDVPHNS
jgi:hypothetical protein